MLCKWAAKQLNCLGNLATKPRLKDEILSTENIYTKQLLVTHGKVYYTVGENKAKQRTKTN